MRRLFPLALFISICIITAARASAGDHLVQATLLADTTAIGPGQTFHIGFLLKIDPGWHVYWSNPGDSGLATRVKLNLPTGFTSGPIEFPVPKRIVLPGDIVNYAYENETMLQVAIHPPTDLATDKPIEISAKVNWLVCKDSCTPGSASVSLEIPVSDAASPANAETFAKWTSLLPRKHDPVHVAEISKNVDLKATGSNRLSGNATIVVHWKVMPTDVQWFPAGLSGINLSDVNILSNESTTTVSYHVDAAEDANKSAAIESVLAYTISGGDRVGLVISQNK